MADRNDYQNSSFFNKTGISFNLCYYPFTSGILLVVFSVFVSLAGFIGNFIVCLIFFATPSLRTRSQFMVINLCVADFLTSVFGLPLEIVWIWLRSVNAICVSKEFLYIKRCVISSSTAASSLILGLVSIERFIVIFWPLRHKDIISTPRCAALISLGWISCVIYGIFSGLDAHRQETSTFAVAAAITCFLLILVCYSCIFFRLLRQNKVRFLLNAQQNQLHSLEKRTSRTIALIVFVYGLCYLPYTVARITMNKNRPERDWLLCLALSHSAFDPVIYFYRSNEYKRAFVNFLRKFFLRKNRVHDIELAQSADPRNEPVQNVNKQ